MTSKPSFYDLLGVESEATDAEIRTAYRKLAKESHPDRNSDDPEAAERVRPRFFDSAIIA